VPRGRERLLRPRDQTSRERSAAERARRGAGWVKVAVAATCLRVSSSEASSPEPVSCADAAGRAQGATKNDLLGFGNHNLIENKGGHTSVPTHRESAAALLYPYKSRYLYCRRRALVSYRRSTSACREEVVGRVLVIASRRNGRRGALPPLPLRAAVSR
jgi:hypothetical protein